MVKFVESHTRDYASDLEVEIVDARGLDKLLLQIVIRHKSNWQNDALRAHRRNKVWISLTSPPLSFSCFSHLISVISVVSLLDMLSMI
jgi:hypothetical protein